MNTHSLAHLLDAARKAGAEQADCVLIRADALGATIRQGQPETIERSETISLGLRVFMGKRSAMVGASDLDPGNFKILAERAVAMARIVPEDCHSGLADITTTSPTDTRALDLEDLTPAPDMQALLSRARVAEAAALSHAGITNSAGASAGYGRTEIALATSAGFLGAYARTSHSTSVSVLAGQDQGMQRDYDYDSVSHLEDLRDASGIGHRAAERALARLNPRKPPTRRMPVVFDPRVSSGVIGHLLGAINGAAIARGTSFLKDRMGSVILPPTLSIIDDPTRPRGPLSRPFDGEGLTTAPLSLVENGVLKHWLLDTRSARMLNLHSNARAARGAASPPSPAATNVYLNGGHMDIKTMIGDIAEGVYLTEMMGSSVNMNTGDYSRGASGFMIRNGAIAEPIAELTIAGNLIDMFAHLTAASDIELRRSIDAPSIRIDGMSVAGQ